MDPLAISQVQRGLIDPKPDVRASATHIVLNRCVALFKDAPFDRASGFVQQQCDVVESQFLKVAAPPYRRGGLLCLRAMLTGLPAREYPESLVSRFCALILPAVTDIDLPVRLAAAEACHELIRCLNFQVLHAHLADFFVSMAHLVSDTDRKIALVGQEVSATAREYVCGSETFHIDATTFVGFVTSTVKPLNCGDGPQSSRPAESPTETAIALWVIEWALHVSGLVGSPLVPHTDTLLDVFLPLTRSTTLADGAHRLLRVLRDTFMTSLCGPEPPSSSVEPVLRVLCGALKRDRSTGEMRLFCFDWLQALVTTRPYRTVVSQHAPMVLDISLRHVTESDELTRVRAQALLDTLSRIVLATDSLADVDTSALTHILHNVLCADTAHTTCVEMQMVCLQWVALLHQHGSTASSQIPADGLVEDVLSLLCRTTFSAVVEVAITTLDLLVAPEARQPLVRALLSRIQRDPRRLLSRLPQIAVVMHADATAEALDAPMPPSDVPALMPCGLTSAGSVPPSLRVMVSFSRALQSFDDLRFVSKAVMTLNGALLTFPEFADSRQALRVAGDSALFTELAIAWRFHVVSLLSLALLCGCDEAALAVAQVIGSAELSPATLLQLDRCVQLLESPVFIPLRSRLASPASCPVLLRALFSILLLLPQTSPQYAALRERCTVSSSMLQWRDPPPLHASPDLDADRQAAIAVGEALREALAALESQERE